MIKNKIYHQVNLCLSCLIRKFAFTKLHFVSQENDTLCFKNPILGQSTPQSLFEHMWSTYLHR